MKKQDVKLDIIRIQLQAAMESDRDAMSSTLIVEGEMMSFEIEELKLRLREREAEVGAGGHRNASVGLTTWIQSIGFQARNSISHSREQYTRGAINCTSCHPPPPPPPMVEDTTQLSDSPVMCQAILEGVPLLFFSLIGICVQVR